MKAPISSEEISSLDHSGARKFLLVAEVTGVWRNYRTLVHTILVAVFLLTPWTTWNGRQTVLINILDREFSFFGVFLRAHNVPLLFFLIAGGALTLALVTSVFGRVWCGWACPQTVFIDGVFRRIEFFVEGNYLSRIKLNAEDLNLKKLFKIVSKWTLFSIAAAVISHSFLAYFVGAHRFMEIVNEGPAAHLNVFYFALFFTALFLFDFGWFREQFCTVMCPYGRIQGLLLDKNSVAVEFDETRKTDCVKCQRCVNVCPVGIDIRNGLQMECIACTACIDACDEIMEKVKLPKKLIRYITLDHEKINLFKPRTLLFAFAVILCVSGLGFSLLTLRHSEVFLTRGLESPYKLIDSENGKQLINHFKLQISNQSFTSHKYKINLKAIPEAQLILQQNEFELSSRQFKDVHFFVQGPATSVFIGSKASVVIVDSENVEQFQKEFRLEIVGPSLERPSK